MGNARKKGPSDCAKLLALKLFNDYNNHISIQILLKAQKSYGYHIDFDKLSLFNGLHCASIFGIDEIVAGLVELEGCDINQKDCVGNTPLVWAASNGHEGVVKILLGRSDVNPDKPGRFGQTPLLRAASNGHGGVVKILLERDDVNPNELDRYVYTPLLRGTREWLKYYSGGTASIPTSQVGTTLHRSCGLLRGARGSDGNTTRAGRRQPQRAGQTFLIQVPATLRLSLPDTIKVSTFISHPNTVINDNTSQLSRIT